MYFANFCSVINRSKPKEGSVNDKFFLGSFAKLQKTTISFMSVCPSAWNHWGPTGRILVKFDIWGCFENMSRELKFD
jgi:hypothetical protein